jgi:hypothetical protein
MRSSSPPRRRPEGAARAELLLEQMNALGTSAMAVGARDLTLGHGLPPPGLGKGEAEAAVRQPRGQGGQALFPASTVLTVGRREVRRRSGVSPRGPWRGRGLVGQPPSAASPRPRACARRRRWTWWWCSPRCPTAGPAALQCGGQRRGASSSSPTRARARACRSATSRRPSSPGGAGRQLARLELSVDGKGPSSTSPRDRRGSRLQSSTPDLRRRRSAHGHPRTSRPQGARGEPRQLEAQRKASKAKMQAGTGAAGARSTVSYLQLGPEVTGRPRAESAGGANRAAGFRIPLDPGPPGPVAGLCGAGAPL